jgi:AcrR family transcriptional regulator
VLAARQGSLPPAPAQFHDHGQRPGPAAAHRTMAEYLRRLQERGEVQPGDAGARAAHFLSGLFGYAFAAIMLAGRSDDASWLPEADAFRRQFVEDFVRGIAVPAGADAQAPHSDRGA